MTILDKIAAYKREEISAAKTRLPEKELDERAWAAEPPRGFRDALLNAREEDRFGLIAEIKRASPSKGLIRADFDPPSLARAYEAGGASCLSVLTDAPSFQGAPEFLAAARAACALPVLRKDFLIDPYQIGESRALGADCVLLIMAMLDDETAKDLYSLSRDYHDMDVLAEVHDEKELDRALALGAELIGVNNRDLHTFETDLGVTMRLAPRVPRDRVVVAESGLSTPDDLRRLADIGVTSFLIGESLMREGDVEAATRTLIGARIRP
ncbi:MAG TPA: indole-3-glycerol phosphate synthase TrpC [Rhizomicrobium sp.]|jgi:indole-3-glycerol phosphate synthase|nr:indole-3-glycerol phosphate synthase TrpC [Rhizomicrobium sp.]